MAIKMEKERERQLRSPSSYVPVAVFIEQSCSAVGGREMYETTSPTVSASGS